MKHRPTSKTAAALFLLAHCVLIAAGPAGAGQQRAAIEHRRLAQEALSGHIRPAYRQLSSAFASLEARTETVCKAANPANLEALKASFAEAVQAWGRIAHIGFGPIRAENRYERIWFWPDRKGIANRQVAAALLDRPEGFDGVGTLAGKSIGVQGLGALEQILYGDEAAALSGPGAPPAFLCGYIGAIASNLRAIALAVEAEWGEDGAFARLWLTPGPDNPSFLNEQETTFTLLKTFIDGVERVRDFELARPLGVGAQRRVLPGPFAQSRLTMVFVAARITGLRSLFASGLAGGMIRAAGANADGEARSALEQVGLEMEFATARADELAAIPDLLGASPERGAAVALGFPLKSARERVQFATGRLTDLPVGFNASDGD
jgi:hypothetical protein